MKALVKKSGEILDIVSEYSMMRMTFKLPIDFPDKENLEITKNWMYEGREKW